MRSDKEIEDARFEYVVSFPLTISPVKQTQPDSHVSTVHWCEIKVWANSPEEAAKKIQDRFMPR